MRDGVAHDDYVLCVRENFGEYVGYTVMWELVWVTIKQVFPHCGGTTVCCYLVWGSLDFPGGEVEPLDIAGEFALKVIDVLRIGPPMRLLVVRFGELRVEGQDVEQLCSSALRVAHEIEGRQTRKAPERFPLHWPTRVHCLVRIRRRQHTLDNVNNTVQTFARLK